MMCQRIGWLPISTIGFGRTPVSSEIRVPNPPARMTAFIAHLLRLQQIETRELSIPSCTSGLSSCPFVPLFVYLVEERAAFLADGLGFSRLPPAERAH